MPNKFITLENLAVFKEELEKDHSSNRDKLNITYDPTLEKLGLEEIEVLFCPEHIEVKQFETPNSFIETTDLDQVSLIAVRLKFDSKRPKFRVRNNGWYPIFKVLNKEYTDGSELSQYLDVQDITPNDYKYFLRGEYEDQRIEDYMLVLPQNGSQTLFIEAYVDIESM